MDVDDQYIGDGVQVLIVDGKEECDVLHDYDIGDILEFPQAPAMRFSRLIKPLRYPSNEYVNLIDGGELECFKEALKIEEKQQWLDAMQYQMKTLHDNHTYDLVKLSTDKRVV